MNSDGVSDNRIGKDGTLLVCRKRKFPKNAPPSCTRPTRFGRTAQPGAVEVGELELFLIDFDVF